MRISKKSFDTLMKKARNNEACFNCAHCIARHDCKMYTEGLKGDVQKQENYAKYIRLHRAWEYNSFNDPKTLCPRHLLTTIYKTCRIFVEKEGLIID